jgi:hypothetical protein
VGFSGVDKSKEKQVSKPDSSDTDAHSSNANVANQTF